MGNALTRFFHCWNPRVILFRGCKYCSVDKSTEIGVIMQDAFHTDECEVCKCTLDVCQCVRCFECSGLFPSESGDQEGCPNCGEPWEWMQ
jgi:hypothetical protein